MTEIFRQTPIVTVLCFDCELPVPAGEGAVVVRPAKNGKDGRFVLCAKCAEKAATVH